MNQKEFCANRKCSFHNLPMPIDKHYHDCDEGVPYTINGIIYSVPVRFVIKKRETIFGNNIRNAINVLCGNKYDTYNTKYFCEICANVINEYSCLL